MVHNGLLWPIRMGFHDGPWWPTRDPEGAVPDGPLWPLVVHQVFFLVVSPVILNGVPNGPPGTPVV